MDNNNKPAAAYSAPNPSYYAPPMIRKEWGFAPGDAIFAAFTFVIGMLFIDWIAFAAGEPGISATLFFVVCITIVGTYLHGRGFSQNRRSILSLIVLLAGVAPFTLYDGTYIYAALLLFDFAAALIWIMNTCGTGVTEKLSGYIIVDALSQFFAVPFSNFAGAFKAAAHGIRGNRISRRGLYALIGVIVSVPVIAGVIALLMSADAGFTAVMERILDAVRLDTIGKYVLKLFIGIPVACYIYGSVFGNAHGRYTDTVTRKGADASLAGAHRIPPAAIRPCLIILAAIYAIFFIAMSAYLFSAFGGDLPASYTYAEYARRGFFELCAVASINLVIIIFVYIFAKRGTREYPRSLRILTAAISAMTVLLILTAAGKTLLYVEMYGLTQLRVYAMWFILLLFCVFVILIVWHIRPMNAGKPIVIVFVLLTLALFLCNTDGLIAKYNVDRYTSGALKSVDTEMMTYMSDAVLPYLHELKENAPDADVRAAAAKALTSREEYKAEVEHSWREWNIQSAKEAG